jgi:hypothetical protein
MTQKRLSDYVRTPLPSKGMFRALYPSAVLLQPLGEGESEHASYATEIVKVKGFTGPASEIAGHLDVVVIPIEKREGAIFSERISIGRTRTNDIVLSYPSISKFHAYICMPEPGVYTLTDADSRNGTTVRGRRLASKESVVLTNGVMIGFGQFHLRFHDPDGLYEALLKFNDTVQSAVQQYAAGRATRAKE